MPNIEEKKIRKKLCGLMEVGLLLHLEVILNKTQNRCLTTLNIKWYPIAIYLGILCP